MTEVNGKFYPMWSQFVEKKAEWIGGKMFDEDSLCGIAEEIEITDVTLEPNGKDSAMMTFHGKEYSCGFDVRHGGIVGPDKRFPKHLVISTSFGNTFFLKRKGE